MLEAIIILCGLVLDQATKIWSAATLPVYGGSVPFIEGVLNFTLVHNYGAAFGAMQNQRTFFLIITPVAMIAIAVVLWRGRKKMSMVMRVALALFLAGGVGNFIDRLILGYVRDFMEFAFISFPVFNVADSCVVVAAALLIIDVLILDKPWKKPEPQAEKAPGGEETIASAGQDAEEVEAAPQDAPPVPVAAEEQSGV